jgi:HSP90 family molecular chaperone
MEHHHIRLIGKYGTPFYSNQLVAAPIGVQSGTPVYSRQRTPHERV